MRIVLCLVTLSVVVCLFGSFGHPGLAQDAKTTEEVLTNDTIITLTKAGLSPAILVGKIQTSKSNFNLSVEELLRLKKETVADEVVSAMLKKSNPGPEKSQPVTLEAMVSKNNANPNAGRVMLVEETNRTAMKMCQPDARTPGVFGNPFSLKLRLAIKGNHAQLRIKTNSPEFELSLPFDTNPSDSLAVVKLDIKSDRREIENGRASLMGGSSGLPQNRMLPVTISEVSSSDTSSEKCYRVKLVNPLPAGEYALVVGQARLFDFGVDTSK